MQLWVWWVLATVGGWGITQLFWFALFAVLRMWLILPSGQGLSGPVGILIISTWALGPGVAQWLVLRNLFSADGWIPASTVCALAYVPLGLTLGNGMAGAWGFIGITVGTLAATAQWLVLRNQVPDVNWWIPASAVGWGIGWFSGGLIADILDAGTAGAMVGFALGWTGTTSITGFALAWLLRDRLQNT